MTINLEKALIKANKKLLTPEELLIVKEYEQHAGLVDNDALLRVGLNLNLKGGQLLTQKQQKLKEETKRFKQERVFHISQIEKTCKDYYLRFLPSVLYSGTIDKELAFKIANFEAAYEVKCQCDYVNPSARFGVWIPIVVDEKGNISYPNAGDSKIQNTFIMAPASSFKLQERPKDPLFFYKINEEYYYLIHKWGNDLNIFRRLLGFWSNSFNWFASLAMWNIIAIVVLLLGGDISVTGKVLIAINALFLITNIVTYFVLTDDYTPFKNKWDSHYID